MPGTMGNKLGEVFVEITAKTDDLERRLKTLEGDVDRKAKKMGGSFAGMFSKIALGATAIIALKKSLDFAREAKNIARDAEEIQSKFDAVFRGLNKESNKWAQEFGKTVGRANQDIKSHASSLGDILKPLGFTTQEALKLSQGMTQLALDVASFNNRQDADVVHSFASAITGERESLKSLGIVISEADVKQEAYQSGLAEVGGELSKTAKAQATINLLYKNSSDAQGDLIRTGDSLANQEKRQQAQTKDLMELFGKEVVPVYKSVISYLSKFYDKFEEGSPVLEVFSGAVKVIGSVLIGAVAGIEFLINSFYRLYEAMYAVYTLDFDKAGDALAKLGTETSEGLSDAYDSIMEMWTSKVDEGTDEVTDAVKKGEDDTTKALGLSAEDKAGILKSYYDGVKFLDQNYTKYRISLINQEVDEMRKAGANEIQLALYKNQELRKLHQETLDFYGSGKPLEDLVQRSVEENKELKTTETVQRSDLPFDESEGELETNLAMLQSIEIASIRAGQTLAGFLTSQINLFGKVNSLAEIFLDSLIKIASNQIFTYLIGSFADGGTGLLGAIGGLFGHDGGTFQDGRKVKGYAGGGDFIVPQGFPNDSYPIMVESGERVTVTPSSAVGQTEKLLAQLISATQAQTMTLASKEFAVNVQAELRGDEVVEKVTQPSTNKLNKQGVNLNEL